jgi:DtxR family transcriptional regulator, Mn-dependent transcriptional regulator
MRVMRKHRLAECLLVSVIQMPWEEVHVEACRWEHVISESVERRLYELLGHPERCPHGNPIPGLAELAAAGAAAPSEPEPSWLAELPAQARPLAPGLPAPSLATADETMADVMRDADGSVRATVTRITEQLQSDMVLMLKLKRAGIQPGREVLLGAVEGGVRVRCGDGTDPMAPADLTAEIASHVFVSRE